MSSATTGNPAGLPVADWTIAYDTAPLDVDGDGGPDTVALGLPASTTATTGSGPLAGTWTTATTGYTARYAATGSTRTLPDGPDVAGLPRTWTVALRYRGNGDPDRTTLPPVTDPTTGRVLLPAEEVVTGYDTYGRPATLLGAGAHVAGTVYTPAGQPALSGSEPTPGAGTWTSTRYDGAGRPARTAWHTTAPDGTVRQALVATTSHDPAGNPTRTTTTTTTTSSSSSSTDSSGTDSSGTGTGTGAVDRVCSAYDALARLTATWTPPTGCTESAPGALDPANPHALAQAWVFDPGTGLPATISSTDATGTTSTALDHQPGTHQLATATSTGPGGQVVRGFTWQPDGTPATWTGPDATTWQITSSTAGATTTLTAGGGPGAGARVDRAVAPDGTILAEHTTTPAGTSLLIDLGPIGRVTITTSPNGQETVTGQRDHRRPDGTLATTRTGPALTDTTAFHTDTHGTPTAAAATTMLDGTTPTGRRWWTAYGAPRGPPDTTSGPAATGWLGRPQHPTVQDTTGLTRLGARDHDPTLGTFTTPDPVTAYGDPGSLDPYTYARWNPLTNSDPTGLWPNWGGVKNTLAKASAWAWKHKAAIAGTVAGIAVGAAACAVTAGLGCVLIGGALAGAAASATTYSIEAAQGTRTWNTRDFLTTTATGAILGAAGGAAGRLTATALKSGATQIANRATATLRSSDRGSVRLGGWGKPSTSTAQAGAANAVGSAAPETELVQRWMSRAELDATIETSLVRGGRDGTHHVADSANVNAHRARQGLALPQSPEVRVQLEVPWGAFSPSKTVRPDFGMPGGGLERTATGLVQCRLVCIWE